MGLSLGATPWRIVRQLLVESLLLALAAATAGVALTAGFVAVFEHSMPIRLYLDWRVMVFAATVAVLTTVAFGLAPAHTAAGRAGDLVARIARSRRSRGRAILIGAQAAFSLALVVTGWQFANTVRIAALADGLNAPGRLALASIDVRKLQWSDPEVQVYYDRLVERVRQLPGAANVALSCACNPWGAWATMEDGGGVRLWLAGDGPGKPHGALSMLASGDFFHAMELELVAGRQFRDEESSRPVRAVMVNQPFADRYLAAQPLGASIRVGTVGEDFAASRLVEVIGVVRPPPVKRTDSMPMIYYPAPLASLPARTLLVRFDGGAEAALPLLRAAIREVNGDVARPEIVTAEQLRWQRHRARQSLAAAVSLLGVLALILAAAGLYGVVSFVVVQRRQEIAVRMALGAEPRHVVRSIMRQALTPAGGQSGTA